MAERFVVPMKLLLRHRQTKESETDRPTLKYRATSRLYSDGLGTGSVDPKDEFEGATHRKSLWSWSGLSSLQSPPVVPCQSHIIISNLDSNDCFIGLSILSCSILIDIA